MLPGIQFPRQVPASGLGAGSAVGEKAGGAILAAAAATGPAAPFVAAVGALVSLISSFVGGGCGQACVASAQAEQIYEYAGQCLDAVANAGMLGQSDLLAGLNALLQGGQQHMQQLAGQDPSAQGGLTNLTKALNEDISAASSIPATAPNPLNVSQAQTLFPGTSGWYAASASAGAQLALSYLTSLASAQASTTSGVSVDTTTGAVSVLGTTFSSTEVIVGLGALGLLLYLMS